MVIYKKQWWYHFSYDMYHYKWLMKTLTSIIGRQWLLLSLWLLLLSSLLVSSLLSVLLLHIVAIISTIDSIVITTITTSTTMTTTKCLSIIISIGISISISIILSRIIILGDCIAIVRTPTVKFHHHPLSRWKIHKFGLVYNPTTAVGNQKQTFQTISQTKRTSKPVCLQQLYNPSHFENEHMLQTNQIPIGFRKWGSIPNPVVMDGHVC